MTYANAALAALNGLAVNANDGYYRNGAALPFERRIIIAEKYLELQSGSNGCRPNISEVARLANTSRHSVLRVEDELLQGGRIQDLKKSKRDVARGPGAKTLDVVDTHVLLALRAEEPSRSLANYCRHLHAITGTCVSPSVISRFFNCGFEFKAGMRKPSLVPYDKFKPENLAKAVEYAKIIAKLNPYRLKFVDEKHLAGSDLFNRTVRADPLTGIVPNVCPDPDFRNTFNIIGICGIDPRAPPFTFCISTGSCTSQFYGSCIEKMVICGQLLPYDVLICDNAAIHSGGENTVLEDWLWNAPHPVTGAPMRILLICLPTRAPELNPIELLWNVLVSRLKTYPLNVPRHKNNAVARASADIMRSFTHEDVYKQYKKCRYL